MNFRVHLKVLFNGYYLYNKMKYPNITVFEILLITF